MLLLHRCVAFAIVVLAFGGCRLVWIHFTSLLSLLKFSLSLHYLLPLTYCRQLCPYAMVGRWLECPTSVYYNQQAEWWSLLNCLVSILPAVNSNGTVVIYRSTNVFCLSFALHKEKAIPVAIDAFSAHWRLSPPQISIASPSCWWSTEPPLTYSSFGWQPVVAGQVSWLSWPCWSVSFNSRLPLWHSLLWLH